MHRTCCDAEFPSLLTAADYTVGRLSAKKNSFLTARSRDVHYLRICPKTCRTTSLSTACTEKHNRYSSCSAKAVCVIRLNRSYSPVYHLKAPCTIDPVLVLQRVCHNIKRSAQFLFVYSQCSSHKGVPLSHHLTMSYPSDQAIWMQWNVFLQSLPEALQPFTVRISCYFPNIYTQFFAFFSKAEAEAVNPCVGFLTPYHHAWLSRSSGPVKVIFSSLISPHKPQLPCIIVDLFSPSSFSLSFLKPCSDHSLSFTFALLFSAR